METINTSQLEKLARRDNYATWKFAMQAYLESEDLWGCVEGQSEYTQDSKKMTKARAKIILSVEKINFSHLQGTTTPKEAWEKLRDTFEDNGVTRKVGLLRILTSTRLKDCNSVEAYVNQIISTAHKLKELDFEVKDEMIAALMLSGLPEEYKPMLMGLEGSGMALTADAVKIKLLQDVQLPTDGSRTEQEAAFYSKTNVKQYKNSVKTSKKCFVCNKPGHFAAKCRYKNRKKETDKENTNQNAFMVSKAGSSEATWYLDSCASSHMTSNRNWLQNVQETSSSVITASNGKLTVVSKGTVKLNVQIGNKQNTVNAEDVLFVPELATNLLSVSKIINKGHKVIFTKRGCIIKDAHGRTKAQARLEGGMYRLQIAEEVAYAVSEATDKENLWHRRLGHLNRGEMDLLRRQLADGIKDCNISTQKCQTCVEGKSSKLPFKAQGKRANGLLHLVHSDLCGPMSINSIGGARYMLTFIDDFSRKKFVYFLKKKSETVKVFEKFKARVENQVGCKIKAINTDNGGEYINKNFRKLLEKSGVVHRTAVPYTPQQNGIAERANRTIVEMARTMLFDAGFSKEYWAEAVSTAVYILNRCPTKVVPGKTPEEEWSGIKPNLKHLKVFGCEAMVHVPKQKRDKWDPKAKKLLFMGYAEDSKGYRLIDPKTHEVIIARDVVFFESNRSPEIVNDNTNSTVNHFHIQEDEHIGILQEGQESEFEKEGDGGGESSGDKTYKEATSCRRDINIEQSDQRITELDIMETQPSISTENTKLRRSERIRKPVRRDEYISYYTIQDRADEPGTVKQALEGPEKDRWMQAIKNEYEALNKNNTWERVSPPRDKKKYSVRSGCLRKN